MDKPASRAIALVVAAGALATAVYVIASSAVAVGTMGSTGHYLEFQYSTRSEDASFYQEAIDRASSATVGPVDPRAKPLQLGIVSHHLLIKELIAEFFARLAAEKKPSMIVLIGPNHRSRGDDLIATSTLPWKTPFGVVQPDVPTLGDLVSTDLVQVNEDAFYDEHSIGSLLPFIRTYLPKIRIVPIIIRPDADSGTVVQLADWFARHLPADALVLGSLDFSHDQTSAVAQRQDEQTLTIMRGSQRERWREAYVDSRKTLLLLLEYSERTGNTELEIVHHTNSGMLLGNDRDPCTSYVNCFFRSQTPRVRGGSDEVSPTH